jgi:hypothetical protein
VADLQTPGRDLGRVEVASQKGEGEKAVSIFEQILEMDPTNQGAQRTLDRLKQ